MYTTSDLNDLIATIKNKYDDIKYFENVFEYGKMYFNHVITQSDSIKLVVCSLNDDYKTGDYLPGTNSVFSSAVVYVLRGALYRLSTNYVPTIQIITKEDFISFLDRFEIEKKIIGDSDGKLYCKEILDIIIEFESQWLYNKKEGSILSIDHILQLERMKWLKYKQNEDGLGLFDHSISWTETFNQGELCEKYMGDKRKNVLNQKGDFKLSFKLVVWNSPNIYGDLMELSFSASGFWAEFHYKSFIDLNEINEGYWGNYNLRTFDHRIEWISVKKNELGKLDSVTRLITRMNELMKKNKYYSAWSNLK